MPRLPILRVHPRKTLLGSRGTIPIVSAVITVVSGTKAQHRRPQGDLQPSSAHSTSAVHHSFHWSPLALGPRLRGWIDAKVRPSDDEAERDNLIVQHHDSRLLIKRAFVALPIIEVTVRARHLNWLFVCVIHNSTGPARSRY